MLQKVLWSLLKMSLWKETIKWENMKYKIGQKKKSTYFKTTVLAKQVYRGQNLSHG